MNDSFLERRTSKVRFNQKVFVELSSTALKKSGIKHDLFEPIKIFH